MKDLQGMLFINKKHKLNPFVQDDPRYYSVLQEIRDDLGETWVKYTSQKTTEGYMLLDDFLEIFELVPIDHKVNSNIVDWYGVIYTVKDLKVVGIEYKERVGLNSKYLKYKTVHKYNTPVKYGKHGGLVINQNCSPTHS